ncbi:MAG: molybdenum cofactor guanylyltransferase [Dehalococcoidia bacterium]|nr:molybdenum cofactor guanylyltransferase [Dehalococcoidia bacterium]
MTAVILAGGMSRRLGRNKALEPFQGEPLIRRVIRRMGQVASNIIIVANDEERVAELDLPDGVTPVIDEYPGKGSLGGIYTGIRAAPTEWAVFCACDMPFPSPGLYHALISNREGRDAVVPVVEGRPEPIHAAYSRSCLEPIREKLAADRLKISGFFEHVRVCYFTEDRVREIDPNLLSFFNINTQQDLEKANQIALTSIEK